MDAPWESHCSKLEHLFKTLVVSEFHCKSIHSFIHSLMLASSSWLEIQWTYPVNSKSSGWDAMQHYVVLFYFICLVGLFSELKIYTYTLKGISFHCKLYILLTYNHWVHEKRVVSRNVPSFLSISRSSGSPLWQGNNLQLSFSFCHIDYAVMTMTNPVILYSNNYHRMLQALTIVLYHIDIFDRFQIHSEKSYCSNDTLLRRCRLLLYLAEKPSWQRSCARCVIWRLVMGAIKKCSTVSNPHGEIYSVRIIHV